MNFKATISTRKRQKLASRAAILAAAKELFLTRGYAATTLRDIAARAGISPGLVFAHVADKQELLQLVLEADIAGILQQEVPKIIGAPVPALLAGLGRAFLEYYGRHPELSRALVGSTLFRPSVYAEQLSYLRGIFADTLGRDRPDSSTADRMTAAELLVSRYLTCVIGFLGEKDPSLDEHVAGLEDAAILIVNGLRPVHNA